MSAEAIQDIIIVGGGPAGISALQALVELGQRACLMDAGCREIALPPPGNFLDLRFSDPSQWMWQLGRNFSGLAMKGAMSPKFRVPGLQGIFEGYAVANRIHTESGFQAAGALALGGLSNVWGCGVARFNTAELGHLQSKAQDMGTSYARVSERIGISGANDDALTKYFGVDGEASSPLPMDELHAQLWRNRSRLHGTGMDMGRARVAVLSGEGHGSRQPCDLQGMCLWGCSRRSTWSARMDAEAVLQHPLVDYRPGYVVSEMRRYGGMWELRVQHADGQSSTHYARQVLLGAGTIATTRLVLAALGDQAPDSVRLLSNPIAAFLLLLPRKLGAIRERAFGLAQLSYSLREVNGAEDAFGNLFSTAGLPVNEFLQYLPITRAAGIALLRGLLPSALVGNVFLPGSLSSHRATLSRNGDLVVRGGLDCAIDTIHRDVTTRLRQGFGRLGAMLLPGSYVAGAPGADLHYAGTLPITDRPNSHQCKISGEVAGLPSVYVIDGASLPILPAKAHTLTIMANSDRIARGLPR